MQAKPPVLRSRGFFHAPKQSRVGRLRLDSPGVGVGQHTRSACWVGQLGKPPSAARQPNVTIPLHDLTHDRSPWLNVFTSKRPSPRGPG